MHMSNRQPDTVSLFKWIQQLHRGIHKVYISLAIYILWYSRRLDAAKPASEDAADAVCASRRSRLAGSWLRASATVSDTAADSSCCMHCNRCHRDECCWVLTHQAREAVVPTFAIIVCPSTPDLLRTCPAELSEYSQIWPWLLAENVLFRVLF